MAAIKLKLGPFSLSVPVTREHQNAAEDTYRAVVTTARAAVGVRNLLEQAAEAGRQLKRDGLPLLDVEYDDAEPDHDPDDSPRPSSTRRPGSGGGRGGAQSR